VRAAPERLSGEEIMVGVIFELLGATPGIAQPEAPSAGCLVTSDSSPGRPPRRGPPSWAGVALIRA